MLALHRVRQGLVKARTVQANQIRGLLVEFGQVIPISISQLFKRLREVLEDGENELPESVRQLFAGLLDHLKELDRRVTELEKDIVLWHRNDEHSRKLEKIPGSGPRPTLGIPATSRTLGKRGLGGAGSETILNRGKDRKGVIAWTGTAIWASLKIQ